MVIKTSLTANTEVPTLLDSIPASSNTAESEGRQLKQCWIQYIEKQRNKKQQDLIMEILWVSEDQAREEDEVGVGEVVMVFSVQGLAHQPQGLLKVVCNEKLVWSGRWHTLYIAI